LRQVPEVAVVLVVAEGDECAKRGQDQQRENRADAYLQPCAARPRTFDIHGSAINRHLQGLDNVAAIVAKHRLQRNVGRFESAMPADGSILPMRPDGNLGTSRLLV
jgi:hypothetical protein